MVGLPGSGKTTISQQLAKNSAVPAIVISRDEIEKCYKDEINYFKRQEQIFIHFFTEMNKYLALGYDVYADAVHGTWQERNNLIQHLIISDVFVNIIFVIAPLELCLKRNKERIEHTIVNEVIIKAIDKNLTDPVNDPFNYNEIVYIKNAL